MHYITKFNFVPYIDYRLATSFYNSCESTKYSDTEISNFFFFFSVALASQLELKLYLDFTWKNTAKYKKVLSIHKSAIQSNVNNKTLLFSMQFDKINFTQPKIGISFYFNRTIALGVFS